MKALGVWLATLLVGVAYAAAIVVGGRDDGGPTLAERINAACPAGWSLENWTVGDECQPLPPGVVRVTCSRTSGAGRYEQMTVAVER